MSSTENDSIGVPPGAIGKMTVSELSSIQTDEDSFGAELLGISYHETVPTRVVVTTRSEFTKVFDVETGKLHHDIRRNNLGVTLTCFSFMKWDEENIIIFGSDVKYFMFSVVTGKITKSWSVKDCGETFRGMKISANTFVVLRVLVTEYYEFEGKSLKLLAESKSFNGDDTAFMSLSKVFMNCIYLNFNSKADGYCQLFDFKTMKLRKVLKVKESFTIACTKNKVDEEIVLLGKYDGIRFYNCGNTFEKEEGTLLCLVRHTGGWGVGKTFGNLYVGYGTDGRFTAFDYSKFLGAKYDGPINYSIQETQSHKAGGFYRAKERFHNGDVFDMCIMTWNGKVRAGESGLELLSGGGDTRIVRVSVGGLPFFQDERDELARNDLTERVIFLRDEEEIYEGDRFGVCVTIKFHGGEIGNVMKILL